MLSLFAYSQNTIHYVLPPLDKNNKEIFSVFKNTHFKDSSLFIQQLSQQKYKLYSLGYLASSIDTIVYTKDTIHVYVYIGDKTNQLYIHNIYAPANFLQGIKIIPNHVYTFDLINQWKEKIIQNAENNAFPFAAVKLDSMCFDTTLNVPIANIVLVKNDQILIDTILIDGKARIRNKFLASYLKLKTGSAYNESNIKAISKHIADLGYIEEERPNKVTFFNEKATINLYLRNRKTSKFDFLIGFLPNNASTGKLLITGQARLYLVNPFGTGGEFFADWQKLQPKTQRLQLAINYPYFLNLPFGFDAKFDLYKRDTSNLDINYRIGVLYNFTGNHYLKGFFENRTTRLINTNVNLIISTLQLPKILDTKNSLYGLEYYFDNLNYKYNPTNGNYLKLMLGAGIRKIEKNTLITKLKNPITGESLESLYNTIPNKNVQFQLGLEYEKYWKIKKRSTIKTAINAKSYVSKNIFENEMFRIGGNRNLRGFDEESIFTPYYSIFTTEYRFLLSKNSYFYTFFDFALVEDRRFRGKKIDTPFGFGTGISLETKIGVFGISYALGKQLNNKIEFRNSKIHFGYVAYF